MKKFLLLAGLAFSISSTAQDVVFDDGTRVKVNHASFDYENIRRASFGMILNLDGIAGSKILTASYLQPEKFHIAANVGFSGASLETTVFFSGQTKEKEMSFAVKYQAAGYNTIKRYSLKTAVRKRNEWGIYAAVNDYGHLWDEGEGETVDNYPFLKQTQVFAGICAATYWHSHLNVDDNSKRRGQHFRRAIVAPFIAFGSVPDSSNYTADNVPRYGIRFMYEVSRTFGLLGAKIRGRTNFIFRAGIDLATNKNKNFYRPGIFGFGVVYNFAEGAN